MVYALKKGNNQRDLWLSASSDVQFVFFIFYLENKMDIKLYCSMLKSFSFALTNLN